MKLSYVDFLAKWAALFPDNTTELISAEDMRDFRQDIADSFMNFFDGAISQALTVSSSPVAVDMAGYKKIFFTGATTINSIRTWTISNDSTSQEFDITITIGATLPAQTFPATFKMPYQIGEWVSPVWTPLAEGVYHFIGRKNGSNWDVRVFGPYI
jgi:hypothetical protein